MPLETTEYFFSLDGIRYYDFDRANRESHMMSEFEKKNHEEACVSGVNILLRPMGKVLEVTDHRGEAHLRRMEGINGHTIHQ